MRWVHDSPWPQPEQVSAGDVRPCQYPPPPRAVPNTDPALNIQNHELLIEIIIDNI